jgi:GNAT superfamily N-acetyltransferase
MEASLSVPIVRDATPDDAESIGQAHAEAWRIGYDDLFPRALLEAAVDVRRRMWVGLVGDPALGGTLRVAEEAGEVVGFIHFGPASGNDTIGEVYGFYVLPSSWGTGSAQALMDRAVATLAESFTLATLWTHAEAGRARRFYAKSCWTTTGNQRQETTWDGLAFPAVEYERVLLSR